MFFIPAKVSEWLISLKQAADRSARATEAALSLLREELSDLKAKVSAKDEVISNLRIQAERDRANQDWLKARVNQLEFEKAALTKAKTGLEIPYPTLQSEPSAIGQAEAGFDDIGDQVAAVLGGQSLGFDDLGDAKADNVDQG